jgi:Putative MetA-pathway of phenol degradation
MKLFAGLAILIIAAVGLTAQDLAPRAYLITPLHSNVVTVTYNLYRGSLLFNGALPITDATGTYSVPILSYYHSFNLFGRSANVTAWLPYAVGTFEGRVRGELGQIYRSGLLDSTYRFSVNLKGGPAMKIDEFRKWHQKTLIGLSVRVVAPTGQYDRTKLINWGSNRWAFKPELGFSRRWGNWILDAYGGAWFFTANPHYFENPAFVHGTQIQTEAPIGSFEGHLSRNFKPRLWISLDGNFWWGGRTSLNGSENTSTLQTSSRVGGTASVPLTKHQSVKFSYSRGAYARFGGDYQLFSVAWQYSWLGKPSW